MLGVGVDVSVAVMLHRQLDNVILAACEILT